MPSTQPTTRIPITLNAEKISAALKDSGLAWFEEFRRRGIDYPCTDGSIKDLRAVVRKWIVENGQPHAFPRSGWDTLEQRD